MIIKVTVISTTHRLLLMTVMSLLSQGQKEKKYFGNLLAKYTHSTFFMPMFYSYKIHLQSKSIYVFLYEENIGVKKVKP